MSSRAKSSAGKRNSNETIKGIASHQDVDVPQLPATALAAVLDCLTYDEVRSCLLAGKAISIDAARHVHTLNIVKPAQMYSPAARRFENVEQVNILCLLGDVDEHGESLCPDAAARIVPFLIASFPKLKGVFVGGPWHNYERGGWINTQYDHNNCSGPTNHRALFRGLVDAFCVALKTGSLPDSLATLDGISNRLGEAQHECQYEGEDPNRPCTFCRGICSNFPFNDVIDPDFDVCLSDIDRYTIMKGRRGGDEVMQDAITKILK